MLVTDDKSLDLLSVHIWRLNIEIDIRKGLDKCCAGPSIISSNQQSVLVVGCRLGNALTRHATRCKE